MTIVRWVFWISAIGVGGGIIIAFMISACAFAVSAVDNPITNAMELATSGGFGGVTELEGGWRCAVMVPCAAYLVSIWPFMLSGTILAIAFVVRRLRIS